MKLQRRSFLLAGSLLAATLLTSPGCGTDEPLQPAPEVIGAWKKAGGMFDPGVEGYPGKQSVPSFHFRQTPNEKFSVLPPPEVPFGLSISNVTDAGLKNLARLTQLQHLQLTGPQLTDAGLKELARLKQLQMLEISSTKVTDAGLKELAGLTQLQELSLTCFQLTDAGLKELASLTQLQMLWLADTQVTDAGVEELQKALPKVRIYVAPPAREAPPSSTVDRAHVSETRAV